MFRDPWFKRIVRMWWPLAASWLLMSVESPAISATLARMANPEINLAAYGGVVFPISLMLEAPIIMLLSASVALSKDSASYRWLYRFMMILSAILTTLHALVAFTPLYDWIAATLIGAPVELIEPGRVGLRIMTFWTWCVAYRRFNQGVMIRFGHSRAVGVGTAVRLVGMSVVLIVGPLLKLPGVAVGAAATAAGVFTEAVYAGLRIRPILRLDLPQAPPAPLITGREFAAFYIPLALTSLLSFAWQPIGSALISRMAHPIESLAVFPVVTGLLFMLRSAGNAMNEVVVALLDEPRSYVPLRRFSLLLAAALATLSLLITATPLSEVWFRTISGLSPELVVMARAAFWMIFFIPGLVTLQSWYQGSMVHGRVTRGIPESIVAFLAVILAVFALGAASGRPLTGLYVGMTAFSLANLAQTGWLWFRSRPALRLARLRDEAAA